MKRRSPGRVGVLVVLILAAVIVGRNVARDDDKPATSKATGTVSAASSAAASPKAPPPAEPSEPAEPVASDDAGGGRLVLTRKAMGRARWPLTVDRAVVWCDGADGVGAVYVRAGGAVYPVNGLAEMWSPDLPDIKAIWRRSPRGDGTRVNIGPIIDAGLKTCQ